MSKRIISTFLAVIVLFSVTVMLPGKSGIVKADGVIGDVNGDGKINAKDVTSIMKYLVGKTPLNFMPAEADYDGNGKINAKDVTKLMKYLVSSVADYSNLVTEAFHDEIERKWNNEPIYCIISLPKINIDSEDVRRINNSIMDMISFGYPDPWKTPSFSYEWFVNGDILSVIVTKDTYYILPGQRYHYYVYNVCISSGKESDRDDVLSACGFPADDYLTTVKKAAASEFKRSKGDMSYYLNSKELLFPVYNSALSYILSDEYAEKCAFFINEKGDLSIIADISAANLSGYGSYSAILDIEDFILEPDYDQLLEID